MEDTLRGFDIALSQFLKNDIYLLQHDISERSITHKLAEYLKAEFREFHTDCEYNGDIDNPGTFRKELGIDRDKMIELAVRKIDENDTYNIYPDVIVHFRGSNDNNLLVIEVKKRKGGKKAENEKEFDKVKLGKFTTKYRYRLGIFLEFDIDKNSGVSEIAYFQGGEEAAPKALKDF